MMDIEATSTAPTYTVARLLTDVQNGIWSELVQPHPRIDIYGRNLQRAYFGVLRPRLVGDGASQSDFRPLAFSTLRTLQKQIEVALPKTTDPLTAEHLRDAKKQISDILDPKFGPSVASASQIFFPFFVDAPPPPQDEKYRPDFRCSLYQPVDWRTFFFGHD
jgi:hypothetical protein